MTAIKELKEPRRKRDYSILITDDDKDCRETLREIVELQGFHTILAKSGEEAVDILRDVSIHLALLDMHLPSMTGLEVIRVARQFYCSLPVILVTGDASETVVRQAQQQQVYSVIPKPVSKSIVLYTILRALTRFYGDVDASGQEQAPEQG
jgi:CheY-like chemotaxis protein